MAIGTTAAILGSAAIGAGAGLISAREQSDAISDAQRAQDQGNREALQYARETRDMQLGLAEPFRQFGIQQANFLGEIFGFDPVGMDSQYTPPANDAGGQAPLPGQTDPVVAQQNQYAQYVNQNPDLVNEWNAFLTRPGGRTFGPNLPASYDLNGDGNLSVDEYGAFHFDRFGRGEGRTLPGQVAANDAASGAVPGTGGGNASTPGAQVGGLLPGAIEGGGPVSGTPGAQSGGIEGFAMTGGSANGINTDAQNRARERFQGSLFSDALNGQLADVATGIDANMAASGSVYSGARESAQGLARSRYGMDALTRYISAGLGQPSTSGAQMAGNAAGQFGATAGNLAMAGGQTAANSAYARGDVTSGLVGNLANLGAYGLGAFSGGGNRSSSAQAGDFNLGYGRTYNSAFAG